MTVLLYHGFAPRLRPADEDPHSLFMTGRQLEGQLRLLHRCGLRPTDLDGWLEGRTRSYLVTFDDAYASVLAIAQPILAAFGAPAVLFVPPALMGRSAPPERIMGPDELRRLAGLGFELGVHGLDHTPLTEVAPDELAAHTAGARADLEDVVGRRVRAFAYPNGAFDDDAAAAVAAAGFEVGFSVDRDGGRHAVPRTALYGRDSLPVFVAKVGLGRRSLRPLVRTLRRLRP